MGRMDDFGVDARIDDSADDRINDPGATFERFRPLREALRRLQGRCVAYSGDYNALAVAIDGLDTAAGHFTGDRAFYGPRLWRQGVYTQAGPEEYPRP